VRGWWMGTRFPSTNQTRDQMFLVTRLARTHHSASRPLTRPCGSSVTFPWWRVRVRVPSGGPAIVRGPYPNRSTAAFAVITRGWASGCPKGETPMIRSILLTVRSILAAVRSIHPSIVPLRPLPRARALPPRRCAGCAGSLGEESRYCWTCDTAAVEEEAQRSAREEAHRDADEAELATLCQECQARPIALRANQEDYLDVCWVCFWTLVAEKPTVVDWSARRQVGLPDVCRWLRCGSTLDEDADVYHGQPICVACADEIKEGRYSHTSLVAS